MSEYATANDHVQRWVQAQQARARRLEDLRISDKELAEAAQSLGKFVSPKFTKPGEIFLLWVNGRCVGIRGDILLQVQIPDNGDGYLVSWRDKETGRFIYSQPESYRAVAQEKSNDR